MGGDRLAAEATAVAAARADLVAQVAAGKATEEKLRAAYTKEQQRSGELEQLLTMSRAQLAAATSTQRTTEVSWQQVG